MADMKTVVVRLPEPLAAWLADAARQRGTTKSEVLRDALELLLKNGGTAKGPSAYDLAKDLIGAIDEGPTDLSYNPKHMEGFGE